MSSIIDSGGVGIYFLKKKGEVVYIGRTTDFLSRMASHRGKDFDSARLIECNKELLRHYENRWVRKFTPKLNKCMPIREIKKSGRPAGRPKKPENEVKTMFSFRCPPDLLAAFKKKAKKIGITDSHLAEMAFAYYVDLKEK